MLKFFTRHRRSAGVTAIEVAQMVKDYFGEVVLNLHPGCLEKPTGFDLAAIEAAMLWPDNPRRRVARTARV